MENIKSGLCEIAFGQDLMKYSMEKITAIFPEGEIVDIFAEHGVPRFLSPDIDFLREEINGFRKFSDFINMDEIQEDDIRDRAMKYKNYIAIAMHNNCFIAINPKKEIVMIDYERWSENYVNRDIIAFLSCVILINRLVMKTLNENPECDYFGDCLKDEDIAKFVQDITCVDERAMDEKAFWNIVLDEIADAADEW